MAKYTAFPLLQQLESTLTSNPPYCSGVLEVPHDAFKLYYGRTEARYIDLQDASRPTSYGQGDLETLAKACEAARFGRGDETVLDETYRKASKMDSDSFMTGLDPLATGILDALRLGLLSDETRTVHAELYKLNVYGECEPCESRRASVVADTRMSTGEGAFFKPHKDTPRSQSMFGSLVVVFPTPHEGGALILRHYNEEFTFDAATLLSERTSSIAYVAFFSDVEHEVLPVLSGRRVTLTYNLYYGAQHDTPSPRGLEVLQPPHASASAVRAALASLLADRTFLPSGGTLGFGLRHAYPFPKPWTRGMPDPLSRLPAQLKGSDAALFAACAALGAAPLLQLVCRPDEGGEPDEVVLDRMLELGSPGYVESAEDALRRRGGLHVVGYAFTGDAREPWKCAVHKYACATPGRVEGYEPASNLEPDDFTVHWLTGASSENGPCSAYVAYGNEASVGWLYTGVCLLASIGPYGDRSGGDGQWGQLEVGWQGAQMSENGDGDDP